MNRIYSLAKFQLSRFLKAMLVYYLGIALLAAITVLSGATGEANGMLPIAIVVLSISYFKTSFLFSQANNMSRRSFFQAMLLVFLILSVIIVPIDFVFSRIIENFLVYQNFGIEDMYQMTNLTRILWSITVVILAASIGWVIAMVYYRSNPILKVLVSLSPLVLLRLFIFLNQLTEGRLGNSIATFIFQALGLFGYESNPFMAMFSFCLATVGFWALGWLLMLRMPVKAE